MIYHLSKKKADLNPFLTISDQYTRRALMLNYYRNNDSRIVQQVFAQSLQTKNKIIYRTFNMNTTIDESYFMSLQDSEVTGQNCCHSVIKSHSAKSYVVPLVASNNQVKPKKKDKGIKLTHHSSLNSLNNSLNNVSLRIKSHRSMKDSEVEVNKIKQTQDPEQSLKSSPFKIFVTKKCTDYKNKKIKQHNQFQLNVRPYLNIDKQKINTPLSSIHLQVSSDEQATQLLLTPKKTQANLSTERNTPRDMKYSEIPPSYQPSIIARQVEKLEINPVQSQIFKEGESTIIIDSNRKSVGLKVTKSQKTLQKLYQKRAGKKMQVLQSQLSQASEADLVSIAQSCDWRQKW